jgi:ketosteroid isomerase-like protein
MNALQRRQAIVDTVLAYCVRIDALDFDGLAELFTDDAHITYHRHDPVIGGTALAEFLASRCTDVVWHQHLAQPMQVTLDGTTATVTTYFLAHSVHEGQPDRVRVTVGEYVDTLVDVDGTWLIRERTQHTGWREHRVRE